jgi:hypothetical protein
MKRNLLLAMLTMMTVAVIATAGYAQGKGKKPARMQAAEGAEVWVVVNTIKADKREQFEKFVFEIFWPAGMKKLTGMQRKAFEYTRVLAPTKANDDGTWSYVYLMDPVFKDSNYDIETLLKQLFGEEKAREYGQMLEETYAKPQFDYILKQTRVR